MKLAAIIFCLGTISIHAGDTWFDSGWTLRRELTIDTAGQGGAFRAIAFTDIPTLGKSQPDGADFRVTDSTGKELKSTVLASGFEDRAVVAFEASAKGKYWIHWGNPKAKASPQKLDASAVSMLEVRELSEGSPEGWDAAQKMLDAAKVLNRAPWPRPEVNFNPFGPWGRGIYNFQGVLDCPSDGTYHFQSNAQAASFILIDGKLVVDWPGWHNAKKPRGSNNVGQVELKKGAHKFQYVNLFNAHGACLAGWQKPGDRGFTPLRQTDFAGVHSASAGPAESRSGPVAEFNWELTEDMGMDGRPETAVQFKLSSKAKVAKWDFGDGTVSFAESPLHVFISPGVFKVSCEADGKRAEQRVFVRPRNGGRGRQYERRVAEFAAIVKDYPLDGFSEIECFEIAQLCHESGKFDAAVRAFRASFEKGWKPRDAEENWWPQRVYELYRDAGKFDDAVWVCDWLARTLPESTPMAMNLKAEILYDYQDKIDAASETCKSVLQKFGSTNSDFVRMAYIRQGEYMLARGERAFAKTALDDAQNAAHWKKWSGDIDVTEGAHELNFFQYMRSAQWEAALKEIASWEWKTPAIKLTGQTRYLRGRLFLARKNPAQALKEFDRALQADPKAPFADEILFYKAEALEALNNAPKAKEAYAKIVKDFPESKLAVSAKERMK